MLFSKQTPAAGGTAFAQFDAAWCYDGNGYILNDTGTSIDVRIGATGSVQTLAAGGTLPIKLVYSLAELYVRRTDQSTTQVTVEAQVGTGSAGGGTSAEVGVIAAQAAAAAVAWHDASAGAHGALASFDTVLLWDSAAIRDASGTGSITVTPGGPYVQIKTGTTANSRAGASRSNGSFPILSPGFGANLFNADGNFRFNFIVNTDSVAAGGVARLVFGKVEADANGPLAFASFGLEIRERALWGVAWDTALKEASLGFALDGSKQAVVSIMRTTSGFSFSINGAAPVELVCGSIGTLKAFSSLRAETFNNASAAEHRFNFSPICYRTWL